VHAHYYVNTVCQSLCVSVPTYKNNDSYDCGYCSEINGSSLSFQEGVPSDGQQDSSGLICRAVMANVIAGVASAALACS